jgi:(p)ppGpp synthase/HD superfamily hydrolase
MRKPTVADTIEFIKSAFTGKVDKIGVPYCEHPVRVMNNLGADATDDEKLVALLHDVIEDTHYTADDLLAMGYPAHVIDAVLMLSKPEGTVYENYIDWLAATGNVLAIKTKIADNEDNLDPERVAKLPANKMHLPKRYVKSLAVLRPALERCLGR